MDILIWIDQHFGRHPDVTPDIPNPEVAITETEDQISKTQNARGLLYREIDRVLPGGVKAFKTGSFPVLDQIEGKDE